MRFAVIGAGMAGILERDQADRGRAHRLHGLREGRPVRRHLAREHLSRASPATSRRTSTRTRSRSTPGLEPPLLARTRDPGLLRAGRAATTTSMRHVRFGDEVTRCTFVDGRWQLETAAGHHDEVDVVIAATGVLHHPRYPDIEGLDYVRRRDVPQLALGPRRRRSTARASASSAPARPRCRSSSAIVDRVAQLTLFQRTAQWIMPQENPAYTDEEKAAFRERARAAGRRCTTSLAEAFGIFANAVVDAESAEIKMIEDACRANLEDNVHDPELRERLRPDVPRRVQAPDHLARTSTRRSSSRTPSSSPSAIERIEPGGVRTKRRPAARARRARARDRLQGRRVHAADGRSSGATA